MVGNRWRGVVALALTVVLGAGPAVSASGEAATAVAAEAPRAEWGHAGTATAGAGDGGVTGTAGTAEAAATNSPAASSPSGAKGSATGSGDDVDQRGTADAASALPADGSYRISISVDGVERLLAEGADGAPVLTDGGAGAAGDRQSFRLEAAEGDGGAYTILDAEGLALTVAASGALGFAAVPETGGTSRAAWVLEPVEGGFNISLVGTGEVLTIGMGADSAPALALARQGDAEHPAAVLSLEDVGSQGTQAGEGADGAVAGGSDDAVDAARDDDAALVDAASAGPGESATEAASSAPVLASGAYQIAPSVKRAMRVEVRDGSTADGAGIQLYQFNKTSSQSWRLERAANGTYVVRNAKSGKVLDVRDGRAYAGAEVRIWPANGAPAQQWVIEASGDGFVLRSAVNRAFALDVENGWTSNGTRLRLWSYNGSAAQCFLIASEKAGAAKTERVIADGTYVLRDSRGLALDVRNGSLSSGTAMQAWSANGTLAQSYRISYDAWSGFYTITSVLSGLVADADRGDVVSGAPVSFWGGPSRASLTQYWRIEKGADGRLTIINAANGQALGLVSPSNGASAVTVPVSDARARTWSTEPSSFKAVRSELDALAAASRSALPDGTYLINSAAARASVLDVADGSRSNGVNVRLWPSNMSGAQKWTVKHDAKGYVTFVNAGSGKVLEVAGGWAANGRNVRQNQADGSYAQKWIATKNADGSYRIASALGNAYALEGFGASATANVGIGLASSSATQAFFLLGGSPEVDPCEDILPKGYYSLAPASSGAGRVIEAANGYTSDGTNVQLYRSNGTIAQLFSFRYVDGYYRIVNLKSGRALDVAGGNLAPGGNVQLFGGALDNANELFSAHRNADGTFTFINKATGLALDIAAGADRDGANVQTWLKNGLAPQRFRLVGMPGIIAEGTYAVVSAASGSKVLDVANGSRAEGARVQLWGSNGTYAQKWYARRVGSNVYELESLLSGKLLTAREDGSAVQTSRPASGSTGYQRWQPEYVNGGYAFRNVQTGDVLAAGSGGALSLAPANGSASQRFALRPAAAIADGTYALAMTSDATLRLDVAASSTATGATVQAWGANGAPAQTWDIRSNGDGTYEIANVLSGKVLDVKDGRAGAGASVRLWERNGAPAQRWRIEYDGRNGLRISSALNGSLVLGTLGGGRPTTLVADGAAGSQRFVPVKTGYTPGVLKGIAWKGTNGNHYSPGRGGNDWSVVVIHISECQTLEQIDWTFWGSREASAHYGVGDTRIHQYVNLGDTAWAVGNWFWNQRSISIEHVGTTANPPSYQTLDTSARLMAALARSKGWRSYQMGKNLNIHKNYTDTSCPATLDVNWLYAKANEYLGNGFTTSPAVQPW